MPIDPNRAVMAQANAQSYHRRAAEATGATAVKMQALAAKHARIARHAMGLE